MLSSCSLCAGLADEKFQDAVRHTLTTEGFLAQNAPVGIEEGGGLTGEVSCTGNGDQVDHEVHRHCQTQASAALASDTATVAAVGYTKKDDAAMLQERLLRDWEQRQEAEMEPWEVVRDVLLTWPCSPAKEHIASCRHLLEQQVFVERWLRTSNRGGEGKVRETVRRLLKHVAWRFEYKVEGILEEDWQGHDVRHEMYVSGLDRHKRPSVTWRVSHHDAHQPRGQTPAMGARYLVCTIERARAVNPQSRHIIFICDCSGLQVFFEFGVHVVEVVKRCCCRCCRCCCVCDAVRVVPLLLRQMQMRMQM